MTFDQTPVPTTICKVFRVLVRVGSVVSYYIECYGHHDSQFFGTELHWSISSTGIGHMIPSKRIYMWYIEKKEEASYKKSLTGILGINKHLLKRMI